jgi:hypothetical protein
VRPRNPAAEHAGRDDARQRATQPADVGAARRG